MEKEKIKFKDLSLPLKTLVWLGWVIISLYVVIIIYTIGFSMAEIAYLP